MDGARGGSPSLFKRHVLDRAKGERAPWVESQHSAFFNPQTSLGFVTICCLEGKDDNDRPGLLQVLIPLRAIQSVDTSTSDYGAELVRATGGTIHVILNSGTNQIS